MESDLGFGSDSDPNLNNKKDSFLSLFIVLEKLGP